MYFLVLYCTDTHFALYVLIWGPTQAHCVDTAAVVVTAGHAATVRTDQKDHVFTTFNIQVSTV